jgi:TonB-linked SusC/RagA family outer membrane protein
MGMLPVSAALAQTGVVRGTVLDSASRRPVEGVAVTISTSNIGALTNDAGVYVIRGVPAGSHTVRAARLGFAAASRQVTVTAGDTATADFEMRAAALNLSQVVVVGYGTANRREVTNSIATVRSDELVNTPVASIDAALQGKAPGLQVVQNAGNPGNAMTVRIRGSSSIEAGNQPLYVVDGVPILRDDYSQLGLGGQEVSAISALNPDEIASIDVLKDASAAAIYGSRASNGVVLITTKRGQQGSPRITFNGYYGSQNLERKIDLLNATEYVNYFNEAAANDGYGEEDFPFIAGVSDSVDTDWQEEVTRTAPVYDISMGVSGGGERIGYFLSGTLFNQEGIMLGSSYNRQSLRANLDFSPNSRLSFRTSLGFVREDNNRTENDDTIDGVSTNAIADAPNIPARSDNEFGFSSTDDGLQYTNPLAIALLDEAESRTFRALGNVEMQLALTDALRLNARVGADVLNLRDLRYMSPKVIGTYASSQGGIGQQGNNTATRYVSESFLQYDLPTQRLGAFSFVGGASVEFNSSENDFIQGEGFPSAQFKYVGNAGKVTVYDGGRTDNNIVSFFTRGSWSFNDRYFASGAVRQDGSSRFGENNRYGTFYSGSLGWAISDEPFLSVIRRVGDLKLRVSYGQTGNQGIADDFAPLARFGRANYAAEPGIGPSALGNPDLKWETTREFDIGLDLALLGGRVGIVADRYSKKTDDLLVSRPISAVSGFADVITNIGNIENSGYELQVTTENLRPNSPNGFRWTTDFNIAWNRNEITALYRNEPFSGGFYSSSRVEVGHPLGAFHMLKFLGVDPQTGDAIYDDVNGDGDINSSDRTVVGSPHPRYFGGIANTIAWGGFDLRAFVQFNQGNQIFNAMRVFADDGGYYFDNKFRDSYLGRWRQPGDQATDPRLSYDGVSGAREISTRMLEDGSYVRLQEITVGWRLPRRLMRGAGLDEARIFVTGRNLHTWTDYAGYNPDVNSAGASGTITLGTDFYAYPLARTISFGISGQW